MSGRVWSPYAHLPFKLEPGLNPWLNHLRSCNNWGERSTFTLISVGTSDSLSMGQKFNNLLYSLYSMNISWFSQYVYLLLAYQSYIATYMHKTTSQLYIKHLEYTESCMKLWHEILHWNSSLHFNCHGISKLITIFSPLVQMNAEFRLYFIPCSKDHFKELGWSLQVNFWVWIILKC
jgi:hypothetical protein